LRVSDSSIPIQPTTISNNLPLIALLIALTSCGYVSYDGETRRQGGELLAGAVEKDIICPAVAGKGGDCLGVNPSEEVKDQGNKQETEWSHPPGLNSDKARHVKGRREDIVATDASGFKLIELRGGVGGRGSMLLNLFQCR